MAELERSNIPEGKAVFVLLIKLESAPKRATEDQTGASGDRSETSGRWQSLAGPSAGQWRIGWSKVSVASPHI